MSVSGISGGSYYPIVTSRTSESNPTERADSASTAGPARELTPEEQEQVKELEKRDAEVRRHEQAHKAAAGQYARGGAKYEYEKGPDGRPYAVGGEVEIDTSPVPNDPAATIRKAEIIKRAALAPAEPSPQDLRVASEADAMKAKARKELAEATLEEGGASPVESRRAAASTDPPRNRSIDIYA